MSRRIVFLIILLLVAVVVLIFSLRTPSPPLSSLPSPTSEPTPVSRNLTTLVASPSASLLRIGEEQEVVILVDSGGNNIASVQLEMVFNPEYLSISDVSPLTFFENPTVLLKEINNKVGTLSYALGSIQPKVGGGELAKIKIRALKATGNNSTPLVFLPKTAVGEIGNPTSVLKETLGINVIIR